MSDGTGIEWTDATWNPVTGCTKVSPGCDRCYAETFAERWRGTPGHHFEQGFDLTLRSERLGQPLRWTRPRRIFVNSMSDLFHEGIPDGFIARVWDVMAQCPQHTFQILTKRHARMRSWVRRWADTTGDEQAGGGGFPSMPRGPEAVRATYASGRARLFAEMLDSMGEPPDGCAYPLYDWMEGPRWWPSVLPNVWLGVSVEDQKWADIRIPVLLDTPAAVRWISAEPLLGPVDLNDCAGVDALQQDWIGGPGGGSGAPHPFLDWVVVGGESGRDARPMDHRWARSLRDQCTSASVPFLFKQWGQWAPDGDSPDQTNNHSMVWCASKKAAGRELDGRTWDEYPAGRPA